MKGLVNFLRDAWWVFALAALFAVVMAYVTGWYLYIAFLPILVVVAVYMSFVRYDSDGNERYTPYSSRRGEDERQ